MITEAYQIVNSRQMKVYINKKKCMNKSLNISVDKVNTLSVKRCKIKSLIYTTTYYKEIKTPRPR